MKAVLVGLSAFSAFFIYAFFKAYLKYRKLNKVYKNEYVKILSSDECKVKGRYE